MFSKIVPTALLCSPHLYHHFAFSFTPVLPSSFKTMEQWPWFWHQALVSHEDVFFCPKDALKWFSLILFRRWVSPNQNREHPAWSADVELLLSLQSYPDSAT